MKDPNVRRFNLSRLTARLIAIVSFAVLLYSPSTGLAAGVAPNLGAAQSFAVLGGSTVTSTGATTITGDLGVSPGSAITGFPPGVVIGGTIHANDPVAMQAHSDGMSAYNALIAQGCDFNYPAVAEIGGLTLTPGVHCFPTSAQVTGTLTLDAQGNSNAVFIFKIGSTFVTAASNSTILVINGSQGCAGPNIFWAVGSSATIGTGTQVPGHILAVASITLTTNANVSGSAIALAGAVTMDTNHVAVCNAGTGTTTTTTSTTTTTTTTTTSTTTTTICKDNGKNDDDDGDDDDDDKGKDKRKDKDKDKDKCKDKDKDKKDKEKGKD